jgi:hypothetical protein
VHAYGKSRLLGGLVDRPVTTLAERLDVAAEQQHLNKILVAGAAADFGGGGHAILIGDDNRTFQATVLAGPFGNLPVVDGGRECCGKIVIAHALPGGAERIEYAERDIVGIEQLLLHERQRRTLLPALRRIRIAARGVWLRLGIGRAFHHALIGMDAEGFEMAMPAFRQKWIQFLLGRARRMDVAIGDRGLDADGPTRLDAVAHLDVHGVVSLATGCLRRG